VANYNNALRAPIIPGQGDTLDAISCTPLHIFLGLGNQMLGIIEKEAATLDTQVKERRGECGDKLARLFQERDDAVASFHAADENREELESTLAEVQAEGDEFAAEKENRSAASTHAKARLKVVTGQFKRACNAFSAAQKLLKDIAHSISAEHGPFSQHLAKTLESLKLQRCAYHGGALIGGDVHKLLSRKNIALVCQSLRPRKVALEDGSYHVFGSYERYQRAFTLLSKLSQVYTLASANRPLCRHEIALLQVRAYSFGSFLPVNYPQESVKPKLHVLAYHFAEKAEATGSVGLETEQLIESIHPFINQKERQYASVRQASDQMAIVAKSQWVASESQLPNFRK